MAELLYQKDNSKIHLDKQHSIDEEHLLFFHSNKFINRKQNETLFFNYLENGFCRISLVFEMVDNEVISLPGSPFGGVISESPPTTHQINTFLQVITTYFKKKKIDIIIKQCPVSHLKSSGETNVFIENDFNVQTTDINQHIIVDQIDFGKKINRNRKRKIEACKKANYIFKQLDIENLPEVHNLISECRVDKGYPVTMTLAEISNAFEAFPDHYLLFGVMSDERLIATGISIKVSHDILYNFYHGDLLDYREHSPVSLLVSGIYNYCQRENYAILDLGVSTDRGVLNEGLFAFKKSCGAIQTDKVTYELKQT